MRSTCTYTCILRKVLGIYTWNTFEKSFIRISYLNPLSQYLENFVDDSKTHGNNNLSWVINYAFIFTHKFFLALWSTVLIHDIKLNEHYYFEMSIIISTKFEEWKQTTFIGDPHAIDQHSRVKIFSKTCLSSFAFWSNDIMVIRKYLS